MKLYDHTTKSLIVFLWKGQSGKYESNLKPAGQGLEWKRMLKIFTGNGDNIMTYVISQNVRTQVENAGKEKWVGKLFSAVFSLRSLVLKW